MGSVVALVCPQSQMGLLRVFLVQNSDPAGRGRAWQVAKGGSEGVGFVWP